MASSGPNGLEDVFFEHLAGGNRCGSEKRMDGEGPAVAHNGVRSDDVVEVREARQVTRNHHIRLRRTA